MAKRIGTQGTAPFVIQDTGIPSPAGHSDHNVGGPFHVATLADLKEIPAYYLIDKSVEGVEKPVWGAMGYVHSDPTPENNGRWELKKGLVDNDITNPDNWQKMQTEGGTSETPESIKTKYESNEDTNAFTDAEKLKLAGLQNETGQTIANKYEAHEDVKRFTTALKAKVDGIETSGDGTKFKANDGTYKNIDALPSQTGNAGKVLKTNGTAASWEGLETSDINSLDTKLAGKESIANKGVAGGYAPLDASGMLPASMIPESVKSGVTYKGLWDATSGTPPHISPENGWYWRVSEPGTTDVDGNDEWELSDWIIWNGTAWDRIKNSDRITSVQGATSGDVVITDANVDHQIGITIPSWITSIYTAGKASIRSVLDTIVSQITTMKNKLDGVQNGATKNASDAQLRNRSTHTGEQPISSITGLQVELDGKLTIRGDNFIATRPTANKAANGIQLQNIINELASFTPGGNPLSHTNRAYVLVMPGEYNGNIDLIQPFVDIIGFGSKNGIIINGNIGTYLILNHDHRIENLTVKGTIISYGHTEVCVYRNLTVDRFWCDTLGVFENIEHSGVGNYLFEGISGGTLRNIYTPKALGENSINFEGIIEDCRAEGQHTSIGLSGTVTRSYFKGNNAYDAIFDLHDGAEITYTIIINESDQETGTEWAVTNYNRYGAPDTDKEVRIHHCHFVAKDGALSPKVINTIEHGHNSWDSEGGGGIEDIIEGTNTSIDKTNPKKPIINFTGEGLGAGMFAPVQNLTVLRAIDTTDTDIYKDKWLIHVEDAGLYRFDREGTGVDDGNQIITPTVGGGRWFKMSSSITSHEMLTGVQGGTTGQHYHLTAAEYLIVAATELAFTNAIKQEIEEKITLEDLPSSSLIREEISITGGLLDMTNIDIGDLTLEEDTVISSVAGFEEGSKMINLFPNGYTLDWHSSVVNPVNVDGELSTTEESLILILCTSTDPLKIRVKNESNPTPELPKVDVVLNHGNINSTGEPWSNLLYLSTAGALTTGLHNYDMTPSPVEVKINEEFSINVSNNKNTGLSGDVPNTMIKSCFTNAHTHFGRLIYILNLDDQKTYTISMILCNDTVGAKTDISINGGATQTYDTFELTTWVEIGSFSPTDGIISIGFAKNPESTQDAYLCVTRITEDD